LGYLTLRPPPSPGQSCLPSALIRVAAGPWAGALKSIDDIKEELFATLTDREDTQEALKCPAFALEPSELES